MSRTIYLIGMNVARNAALYAGCPVTTSGATINRFCSSGLQAVASAAHCIVHDFVDCAVGGGVDSISLVQPKMIKGVVPERQLLKTYPALWMPMIETADIVAQRYGVSRERQDEYAVESQRRTAAAQVRPQLSHAPRCEVTIASTERGAV